MKYKTFRGLQRSFERDGFKFRREMLAALDEKALVISIPKTYAVHDYYVKQFMKLGKFSSYEITNGEDGSAELWLLKTL